MSEKRSYYVVSPLQPIGGQWRSSRKVAFKELAEDLRKYLLGKRPDVAYEANLAAWVEWATMLGAGLTSGAAPDGTHWAVEVVKRG